MKYYLDEKYISDTLYTMNENLNKPVNNLNNFLSLVEEEFNIEYNEEQKTLLSEY